MAYDDLSDDYLDHPDYPENHKFESLVEEPNESDTCRICNVPLKDHPNA